MKKYLWILAAAFLLQACSKDEEEGPYVPWRPGDDKEETIDLDKATKVMILTEQAKNRAENERRDKIIETVCENATVDIPQPMVERQIDQRINEMEMRMRYQGLKLEDFLKYTGQTLEQIRANYEEGAKRQVLAEVVLDAIREAEGIDATDEEVDAEIAKYAESAEKSAEDIKKTLSDADMDYFREMVKTQKVIDMIVSSAVEAE